MSGGWCGAVEERQHVGTPILNDADASAGVDDVVPRPPLLGTKPRRGELAMRSPSRRRYRRAAGRGLLLASGVGALGARRAGMDRGHVHPLRAELVGQVLRERRDADVAQRRGDPPG